MLSVLPSLNEFPEFYWGALILMLHTGLTMTIVIRVIMSNRSVGATLSWIAVVFMFPMLGPGIYLLIGELRLGSRRAKLVSQLKEPSQVRYRKLERGDLRVHWQSVGEDCEMLARAAQRMLEVPALPGNHFELFHEWEDVFDRMIQDIDRARVSCDMEFYIWHDAGRTREVADALMRAADRGVTCRLLVDGIGSLPFLRSDTIQVLRRKGIRVEAALPGGIWRIAFVRFDLRMHRKLVLIDDEIGWTGSLNMVDPRFFKNDAGVGQWIDAMTRLEGPAVEALAITFQQDWYVETDLGGAELPDVTGDQAIRKKGAAAVQVLPSGPANQVEAIERLLITAIYLARKELVITTPYFVPSEALQMALATAAQRGVKVIIVVPAIVDSLLVRWASQAFMGDLMRSGVFIAKFHGGLLHTKSVTIDGHISLFGSLNMDPRSFRLNFELTLAIYDSPFTHTLRALQQDYLNRSEMIDPEAWFSRSFLTRFGEKTARLMGPLL